MCRRSKNTVIKIFKEINGKDGIKCSLFKNSNWWTLQSLSTTDTTSFFANLEYLI